MRKVKSLRDVVDWGLCVGCGACAYYCRHGHVSLVNVLGEGIRPRFKTDHCADCVECLEICPGHRVDGDMVAGEQKKTPGSGQIGVALEIWVGSAADPEIRRRASSGGLLTALALYCLEREAMERVVHTAMDEDRPWLNRTVASVDREELMARSGSRYAPASPCDSLGAIEHGERPSVFIGKPCDAAAAMSARRLRPRLDERLGLVLSFFCAGTPATEATLRLLAEMGVRPEMVERLQYRGDGWPGGFAVRQRGLPSPPPIPYERSWGALSRRRQGRCHLCPDGLGRLADISCGDAWHRHAGDGNPGLSLVLVRTERGRRILHGAMEAGYVRLERVGAREVLAAQANLLGRRPRIFGRMLGMKLLGIPTPRLEGFGLARDWLRLGPPEQARTVLGTIRRSIARGLWRRRPVPPGAGETPPGVRPRRREMPAATISGEGSDSCSS